MNNGSIHSQFLEAAFEVVLDAETELSAAKADLERSNTLLTQAKNGAETRLEKAWQAVEALMKESGEYEVILMGTNGCNYKIGYTTPRQSVKIVDVDAVPDEFCKIERKSKLKEIGDLLKGGGCHNWASLEYGEKKLQWKVVKS